MTERFMLDKEGKVVPMPVATTLPELAPLPSPVEPAETTEVEELYTEPEPEPEPEPEMEELELVTEPVARGEPLPRRVEQVSEVVSRQIDGEPEPEPEEGDDLSDLFEVPQPDDNDMVTDHLFVLDEEDDLSDLFDVSREDILGAGFNQPPEPPRPKYRVTQKGRRISRRQPPPPTSLRGIRG